MQHKITLEHGIMMNVSVLAVMMAMPLKHTMDRRLP
jgi:hypothetical protein